MEKEGKKLQGWVLMVKGMGLKAMKCNKEVKRSLAK